jgi:hypothetical protein
VRKLLTITVFNWAKAKKKLAMERTRKAVGADK